MPLDEVAVVSIRTKKLYQNELGEAEVEDTEGVREAVRAIQKVSERQRRRADLPYRAASMQVRDSLFGPFRSAAPFSLLPEDPLLRSAAYQDAGGTQDEASSARHWRTSLFATPDGYRPLDPERLADRGTLQSLCSSLPSGPDGLLFATTEYTLVRTHESGARRTGGTPDPRTSAPPRATLRPGDTVHVGVEATVHVRVLDRRGGTALTITQTGRSDEGFAFVHGQGWTPDQIDGPTRGATTAALEKITSHLQKNIPSGAIVHAPAGPLERARP
jgi:hypothetical protein